MSTCWPLLAEGTTRTVFEWGRIQSNADWILPLGACAALAVLARYLTGLDTRELPWSRGWLLWALRAGTLLCLLVIYLQPQWRSEREVVRNSQVFLLVDTSSSMGVADADSPPVAGPATRADQVAAALDQTGFLGTLRQTHDVVVLRFDEDLHRVATLEKLARAGPASGDAPAADSPGGDSIAGDSGAAHSRGANSPAAGGPAADGPPSDGDPQVAPDAVPSAAIDWQKALAPTGTQTRLGQALRQLIHAERNQPVSGVVVFSDGGQNAGISPEAAIRAAQTAKIPLFTVGLGSTRRAAGVRVYKLEVPPQVHPGDPYPVTGLIQSQGMAGQTVWVELLLRDAEGAGDAGQPGSGTPVRQQQLILGSDGEIVPVKFELTPPEATGRQTVCLRVQPPATDSDPSDDFQEEEIEIVGRRTRVLLFAGGPTREYRFLRTQLYRDGATTLDVLLQTGQPGISQEADRILDRFPDARGQLYDYDCLVAFDPDWQMLTQEQVDLLEGWVAEQGGGLIVVPGPVHAGEPISGWVQNPGLAKIRALYPVEFRRRLSVLESGTYVAPEPWPLDFTREGRQSEFLWLDDTAAASRQAWADLAGVYSCLLAFEAKPGAAVLARFSDPQAAQRDQQPVYLAEQFYGSGRVFYLGSGEMWRLRRVDQAHFERFYTRLIRHVSQGRLLRQSSRGALMVGQDRYPLGDTVQIRAQLMDARLDPLETPEVALEVIRPDGTADSVTLRPEPSRAGMYAGQLTVLQEGVYRLELPVPESSEERLARRIRVRLPDLERENPQRNDKLLSRIAQGSGGKYYHPLEAAIGPAGSDPLPGRLKDRTKTVIQTGSLQPPSLRWLLEEHLPDRLWQQRWFSGLADVGWVRTLLGKTIFWWLMIVSCSLLCCEWLIRRLSKLA